MQFLSLNLGAAGSCRGVITEDGSQIFSCFDSVNSVCNKPLNSVYGKTTFKNIQNDPRYSDEMKALVVMHQFPGKGQKPTPCMAVPGLHRLLVILGSKVATECSEIIKETFTRVMAGDQSLIKVIDANVASNALNLQARSVDMVRKPAPLVIYESDSGKKREREAIEFDLALEERKQIMEERQRRLAIELEERKHRLAESRLTHIQNSLGFLHSLENNNDIDEPTKSQLADYMKKSLIQITPDIQPEAIRSDSEKLTLRVSVVAKEMGYTCSESQRMKIGRVMAEKYREKYNKEPLQKKQKVNDMEIDVNAYTERDRDMMEASVREIMH